MNSCWHSAFLGELAHASGDPQAWTQRQAEFQQLFMDDGLQRWYAFSDAFLHAPDLIGDATSRRTVLSALMTATGPYRQYMHRLAALAESIPKDTRPEWLIRAIELNKRSEEHTSELQSLMRISYAVFCLKKKKNKNTT